jgi:ABC-type oligopeptide transport system ATPase subunit
MLEGEIMGASNNKLLEVKDLKVHFPINLGGLPGRKKILTIKAVDGVSFNIIKG